MQPQVPLAPHNAAPLAPGDLLNEQEAAVLLNTAVRTLRNWRALRKGPPYRKIGQRAVRYHRADLEVFARIVGHAGDGSAA